MTDKEAAAYPGAQRIDHTREVVQPIGRPHSTSDFSDDPGGLRRGQ